MSRLIALLAIPGWILLCVAAAFGIADAVLSPTPAARQPDFIDTVFASRAVVVAIRLAIISAAVFVVLSVVALIARRQWLTRVGPVEVTGRASELEAENQRHKEDLETAHLIIDALEGVVADTRQVIDRSTGV